MTLIKVIYGAYGAAMADSEVDSWISMVLHNYKESTPSQWTYCVANEAPINALRLAIAEGKIDHTKVEVWFNGNQVIINEYGAIAHWPDGFCDINGTLSEKILIAALFKRKAKRYCGLAR